jgi:hypothetical protein
MAAERMWQAFLHRPLLSSLENGYQPASEFYDDSRDIAQGFDRYLHNMV